MAVPLPPDPPVPSDPVGLDGGEGPLTGWGGEELLACCRAAKGPLADDKFGDIIVFLAIFLSQ